MHNLIINSWVYHCHHWIYVVSTRVTPLKVLVLNEKLDDTRSYEVSNHLPRWGNMTKNTIENRTYKDRDNSDNKQLLFEELYYIPSYKCI